MAQQFVVDQLIEKAQAATGLERFDSQSFREGLEILVKDLNALGVAEPLVQRNENEIVGALANQLPRRASLVAMDLVRAVIALLLPFIT